MKIGFLGAGNLAASMIKGLQRQNAPYAMLIYDINAQRLQYMTQTFGVTASSLEEIVREAEILLLLVKPNQMGDLLAALQSYDLRQKLLITTAAGMSLSFYEARLPTVAFVRVMPNTSSAVLHAVSGLAAGPKVTAGQKEEASRIFSALGKVLWLDEEKMNALTAVSGSGPAYFYLLTELMARAGVSLGLSPEEAELLARETLIGAGKMLEAGDEAPSVLRELVTSPGGTTHAALQSLENDGMPLIVKKALEAAARRALEMEKENA